MERHNVVREIQRCSTPSIWTQLETDLLNWRLRRWRSLLSDHNIMAASLFSIPSRYYFIGLMLLSLEKEGPFLASREGERASDIDMIDFSTGVCFREKDTHRLENMSPSRCSRKWQAAIAGFSAAGVQPRATVSAKTRNSSTECRSSSRSSAVELSLIK